MHPTPILDGLCFAEAPRWRDGKLWFSDMHAPWVMTVDLAGRAEKIVEVPGHPSGLGWLPDGRLLVVSMEDRRLLRLDPGGLSEVADLSRLASFHLNDMIVDAKGRAYIGNFGFDLHHGAPLAPAELILVEPDGRARVVAGEMLFPNGTVITPDGRTMIIGESAAARLTAFDIEPDGALANRRIWAQLESDVPDGICLDAEGAIWMASPFQHRVVRVRQGGEVTHRIPIEKQAWACMLGGPQRRTLFICTASDGSAEKSQALRDGRIEIAEVEVPGAGLP